MSRPDAYTRRLFLWSCVPDIRKFPAVSFFVLQHFSVAFNDFLERKFSFEESSLTAATENIADMIAKGDWSNLSEISLNARNENEESTEDDEEPYTFDA